MGNQIEFRHFKYFLAMAEDLHFRKAAERLYISQPGLSRQIKQLEDSLGISLFERHNRKVELTKAGRYLKNELARTFKNIDDVLYRTKLLNDGIDGNLKLGYVGSAMQKVIPEILMQFREKHPNIIFSLKEMDNTKQIQGLLNQGSYILHKQIVRQLHYQILLLITINLYMMPLLLMPKYLPQLT